MTKLAPLWLAIADQKERLKGLLAEIDDRQRSIPEGDSQGDVLWEECQDQKAQAEHNFERDVCELAGIPYYGWAYDVHRCAYGRDDRETIDMAYNLKEYDWECGPYRLFMLAMVWQAPNAYRDLLWSDGLPGWND